MRSVVATSFVICRIFFCKMRLFTASYAAERSTRTAPVTELLRNPSTICCMLCQSQQLTCRRFRPTEININRQRETLLSLKATGVGSLAYLSPIENEFKFFLVHSGAMTGKGEQLVVITRNGHILNCTLYNT